MKKNLFLIVTLIVIAAAALLIFGRKAPEPKARIAFVLDDWGYNFKHMDILSEIERPITVSILPNLRYSRRVAESLKDDASRDIILHLPLESQSNIAAEVNTIRSNMEESRVLSILKDDIESIPGLIGVSNHQGSKGTSDKALMSVVLNELKKRNLFFLDSLTTSHSVCSDIASGIGLKYAVRDVFLDLTDQTDMENFEAYITKQVNELADIALAQGSAIGVGHAKEATLKVIRDSIPQIEKRGIKIVPLKQLVE